MAGRIPSSFIDELLARIDIVDVIDSRVPLKKAGREYKACCPFHGEKTPSFTVSTEKQFYHCFGCGAHGTALGFLIDYEHLSFPEAVETLAQSIGLEVPYEGGQAPQSNDSPAYEALKSARSFYQAQLRNHADGPKAVAYLKQRGLSGEIAKRYGLGYAPPGYETLRGGIGRDHSEQVLLEAGLLSEGQRGRPYDRFRDRVMFPIHDRRGRVVGFGGRVMGDGEPKYLNSPETSVFHKGRELYGLYEARTSSAKLEKLIVVEGYMDVVSLAQFGIHYAVAALGTSITAEQVELCFRSVQGVVFCFDGDRAGRDAAWRAAENALTALNASKSVQFLFLPDGHDPDSLIREEGVESFTQRQSRSTPFATYFFSHLTEDLDMSSVDGRASLSKRAMPLIQKIKDPVYRELMLDELAGMVRMSSEKLESLQPGEPVEKAPSRQPRRGAGTLDPSRSPVRMALALLMHTPQLAKSTQTPAGLDALQIKGAPLLVELLETARQIQEPTSGSLLERLRDHPAHNALAGLLSWEPAFSTEAEFAQEWEGVFLRLRKAIDQQRWQTLTTKAQLNEDEKAELSALQHKKLSDPEQPS